MIVCILTVGPVACMRSNVCWLLAACLSITMTFCPVLQDAACVLTVWFGFFYWIRINSGANPLKYYLVDTVDVFIKKKRVGKLIVGRRNVMF